jgi:alcohol oxidase
MGGLLGGGSSINFMMYTRAQGCDFDSWNTPGWSAKDMLPLLNKLETYHPTDCTDKSKHGYDGPINISSGGYRGKSEDQFLETVKSLGHNVIDDLQDLDACGGFAVSHCRHGS